MNNNNKNNNCKVTKTTDEQVIVELLDVTPTLQNQNQPKNTKKSNQASTGKEQSKAPTGVASTTTTVAESLIAAKVAMVTAQNSKESKQNAQNQNPPKAVNNNNGNNNNNNNTTSNNNNDVNNKNNKENTKVAKNKKSTSTASATVVEVNDVEKVIETASNKATKKNPPTKKIEIKPVTKPKEVPISDPNKFVSTDAAIKVVPTKGNTHTESLDNTSKDHNKTELLEKRNKRTRDNKTTGKVSTIATETDSNEVQKSSTILNDSTHEKGIQDIVSGEPTQKGPPKKNNSKPKTTPVVKKVNENIPIDPLSSNTETTLSVVETTAVSLPVPPPVTPNVVKVQEIIIFPPAPEINAAVISPPPGFARKTAL